MQSGIFSTPPLLSTIQVTSTWDRHSDLLSPGQMDTSPKDCGCRWEVMWSPGLYLADGHVASLRRGWVGMEGNRGLLYKLHWWCHWPFHFWKLCCLNHIWALHYFISPFPSQSVRSSGQEPWVILFCNHQNQARSTIGTQWSLIGWYKVTVIFHMHTEVHSIHITFLYINAFEPTIVLNYYYPHFTNKAQGLEMKEPESHFRHESVLGSSRNN